jgi:hypothetical protein
VGEIGFRLQGFVYIVFKGGLLRERLVFKGIQVVGVLVGLYLAGLGVAGFARGGYSWRRTGFWVIFGSMVSILFIDPVLASFALPFLTTQDTITTVLTVGILIAFSLIAQLYRQLSERDRQLTRFVQEVAVRGFAKEYGLKADKEDEE